MAGLAPFFSTFNDPKSIKIATLGDSTVFGTGTTNNLGWPGALRSLVSSHWGTGSDGIHDPDRNMTFTTSGNAWTKATTSDVWDVSMGLANGAFSRQATFLGDTSSKIVTWTKPAALTVNAFTIWAVDGPSSGNFSYSTDGGTNWTNVSQTWTQNNSIKQITINAAITGTNTVKVRGANAAGTAVNCYFIGVEPKTTSSTYTIYNLGAAGENSTCFVRTTSGNWHAWLDTVQPQLVFYQMTNDVQLTQSLGGTDITGWRTYIESLLDIVVGYGGCCVLINYFEQTTRDVSMQAAYRAQNKDIAANYGFPCIDFYDLVGDYNASVSAGYQLNGDVHPTDAGATYMAQQIWKVIGRPQTGVYRRT